MLRASLLVVALIVVGSLTGCGKKGSTGPASGAATPNPEKEKENKQGLAILAIRNLNGNAKQKGKGWEVNLSSTRFRDPHIDILDDLQPLVALNLSNTGITNDLLLRLGTFEHLEN